MDSDGTAIDDALDRFGLGGHADAIPPSLSSGQKQRLMLALVLLRPSRLLVLDEPEQRLDPDGRAAVAGLLADYLAGAGTILMASHDEAFATASGTGIVSVAELGAAADGADPKAEGHERSIAELGAAADGADPKAEGHERSIAELGTAADGRIRKPRAEGLRARTGASMNRRLPPVAQAAAAGPPVPRRVGRRRGERADTAGTVPVAAVRRWVRAQAAVTVAGGWAYLTRTTSPHRVELSDG